MGCFSSSEKKIQSELNADAEEINRQVNEKMKQEERKEENISKLLFLGGGGSGKSTLFKHLQVIHLGGFDDRERTMSRTHVWEQLHDVLSIVTRQCILLFSGELKQNSDPILPVFERFFTWKSGVDLFVSEPALLSQIWKHHRVQQVYTQYGSQFSLPESTVYFMSEFARIKEPTYIPTDEDILLVRSRTSGASKKTFKIRESVLELWDVGGQVSERKKWYQFFDEVKAIVFVISLTSYNELTFDTKTNGMEESVQIFDSIINHTKEFQHTPFILFFNKCDLFAKKIKQEPITMCPLFTDKYNGPPNDEKTTIEFIVSYFENLIQNSEKPVWTHVTNATDKQNVETVFNDVQGIIVSHNFSKAGVSF